MYVKDSVSVDDKDGKLYCFEVPLWIVDVVTSLNKCLQLMCLKELIVTDQNIMKQWAFYRDNKLEVQPKSCNITKQFIKELIVPSYFLLPPDQN